MKKSVLENIRVVKVENGFVVNLGERSFVSLDEDGVKEIINGEVPILLKDLEKKQNEPVKDTPPPTTEGV